MLLLLTGKLPQGKIFADLFGQLLPVAFRVSIGLELTGALPVGICEDGLKIGQEVMMLLPLTQQQPKRVEHVLLVLYTIFELSFLDFWILSYAVYYGNLLVDLLSDGPIVLREVVDQIFAGVADALAPKSAYCGHFGVEFELFLGFEDYLFQEV